ncbi:MAG: DUF1295 domain-containing protein, partial [Myxococcota bacterium]
MRDRKASLQLVTIASVVSLVLSVGAGVGALQLRPDLDPLWVGLWADVVGTFVIFGFSVRLKNASMYDAYWSVAPVALALYWAWVGGGDPIRMTLVLALVSAWGVRLTYSWARGWTGLDHEDWRYVDLREKTGAAYPLVNLLGIHFFPTAQVFLGMLPVHAALTMEGSLGVIDGLAAAVTALAIYLETRADRELHDFRLSKPAKG